MVAHTGLHRGYPLVFAHVFAVFKMPSTCPSRITEHHRCSSTLLSVLLSIKGSGFLIDIPSFTHRDHNSHVALRISHVPQLGNFPLALLRIISLALTARFVCWCSSVSFIYLKRFFSVHSVLLFIAEVRRCCCTGCRTSKCCTAECDTSVNKSLSVTAP